MLSFFLPTASAAVGTTCGDGHLAKENVSRECHSPLKKSHPQAVKRAGSLQGIVELAVEMPAIAALLPIVSRGLPLPDPCSEDPQGESVFYPWLTQRSRFDWYRKSRASCFSTDVLSARKGATSQAGSPGASERRSPPFCLGASSAISATRSKERTAACQTADRPLRLFRIGRAYRRWNVRHTLTLLAVQPRLAALASNRDRKSIAPPHDRQRLQAVGYIRKKADPFQESAF